MQTKQLSSGEIVCHNCGYHWLPEPRMWKNTQFVNRNGRRLKILHCPACNAVIGIDRKQYSEILCHVRGVDLTEYDRKVLDMMLEKDHKRAYEILTTSYIFSNPKRKVLLRKYIETKCNEKSSD